MRPRFTLRTLLILTALAAAACYWFVARPTIVANRFVAAVNRGDYPAAQALAIQPASWDQPPDWRLLNTKPLQYSAQVQPRTWVDLCCARRRIQFQISPHPEEDDATILIQDSKSHRFRVNGFTTIIVANGRGVETNSPFLSGSLTTKIE